MQVKTLPQSLHRLVDMLTEALAQTDHMTPSRAREIVLAAEVQVEDMMVYADFDHPVADCYGRQMVYDGGHFEVMVMSWNPGDYSSIHNHGYTQWGVVQVFGHTHHFMYRHRNDRLEFARREILPAGTAIKVNHELIHQMGNTTSDRYLTLHIYGSNERDENVTADAKNYDLEHQRISHTTGGAFFNLPAAEVYDFEPGPEPTDAVFFHYAHLLMDYYRRQPDSDQLRQMKQHLLEQIETRVRE
ncbi:MAG: cysteine dioxygenase [Bacteroidetes bacterium]|nr:MAG: cysteine dioxygenase [Bacteroidota bacterium]